MYDFIKKTAAFVGFDACGIAKAERLDKDAVCVNEWLQNGCHGEMAYLSRNVEKRVDPVLLTPGCRSVVMAALNYYPRKHQNSSAPQIAKYAYSATDYHQVVKEKLSLLEKIIREKYGEHVVSKDFRHCFVDSAPVLERAWAERAGLGWIGKHTQLIVPQTGSYCFLGVLLLNAETHYDKPVKNRCGTCTRCISACPTRALSERGMDARRCLAYLTIEKKGEIPVEFHPKMSNCLTGCDVCADVCPWNKKWATPNTHPELTEADFLEWDMDKWQSLSEEDFNRVFKKSAVKRAGYKKIGQNLQVLSDHTD
ncbi:MAG: tRNA epoxyqueuosine(34) reductase QueG [Prevotellaceae bacterium]|jgi:epoxyqueuosine reductase|nr:tRNA epoxyqueuosine(34) reductase QueG [Prevotellaceae bacterium]